MPDIQEDGGGEEKAFGIRHSAFREGYKLFEQKGAEKLMFPDFSQSIKKGIVAPEC